MAKKKATKKKVTKKKATKKSLPKKKYATASPVTVVPPAPIEAAPPKPKIYCWDNGGRREGIYEDGTMLGMISPGLNLPYELPKSFIDAEGEVVVVSQCDVVEARAGEDELTAAVDKWGEMVRASQAKDARHAVVIKEDRE